MRIIDVSAHNGNIAWDIVKGQIDGAIIRIGYRGYGKSGNLTIDRRFNYNHEECKRLNIPREFYFFPAEITRLECMESAVFIMKMLQEYKDQEITIWLDSEYSNGTHSGRADKLDNGSRSNMLTYLASDILDVCPKWKIGIYASNSWIGDKLDYKKLSQYFPGSDYWWVARWGSRTPDYPFKWWQYSDKEFIDGIGGRVDMSC